MVNVTIDVGLLARPMCRRGVGTEWLTIAVCLTCCLLLEASRPSKSRVDHQPWSAKKRDIVRTVLTAEGLNC